VRVVLLAFLVSSLQAATLTENLRFSRSQFSFAAWDTTRNAGHFGHVPCYDVVLSQDMDVTDEPGAPQLPVQPVVISLPGRCRVAGVSFEVKGWEQFDGRFDLFPCQRQRVLVDTTNVDGLTAPDAAIYQSQTPYPESPARWTGTGFKGGNTLVQLLVYPMRYVGAAGRLDLCRGLVVHVDYEPAMPYAKAVLQDDDLGFDYVIITATGYDTVFQRLADWKTRKGVKAVVRDVAWITATYPGRDDAERLRNYLKTLPDSGARYVLLGGDVAVVPFRKAFAMNCEWGGHVREDSLPCDLYFADLDGTWDANGNNVFGEVADSVDLYADVAVGRAPVDQISEAQGFVRKVMDYEHASVPGYQNKGLFFAMLLWVNPYTDQGIHKNRIEQQSFPSGYNLTKLYQSLGNESRASVMQAMRDNQNFMNHDGHGWIDVMACGDGSQNYLRTGDGDTITNSGCGILYSIGCWTTAFDFTSIGEAFVANPHGGTVATIGNSSYGWGSPGNPGFGYSDKFDNHFWHAVTSEGAYRVGDALAAAKAYYAPFSRDRNVYRWHQYELNLMGDPEMPVWTALPESLTVEAPLSVGLGQGRYLVTVSHAGQPVPGALVCLMKPGESYSRGLTDVGGRVWLDADVGTTGQLRLTATAHNYYPCESYVTCDTGAYVNFAGWTVNDSTGNNDRIPNPGEVVALPSWVRNTGDQASGPVEIRLRTSNPDVTILDSVGTAAALAPGDSVLLSDAFRVQISSQGRDGEAVQFEVEVTGGCLVRTFRPVLLLGEPAVGLDRHWVTSLPLLPGETKAVKARLRNYGHGFGHGTWCRLVSLDGYVTVPRDSIGYGDVPPLAYSTSNDSFLVAVSSSCPEGYLAMMAMQVVADRCAEQDTFSLLVGPSGFSDDVESGESQWTHGGTGDLWHVSTYRAHSGGHSWYCGDEGTQRYSNNMNAWLTTIPLVVAEDCSLRFWRWFKVPNYGVDGIYVVIMRRGLDDTLDFLGTGGALREPLDGIESDWVQERYDLSWLGVGETIQVKLSFKSDGDTVNEGFYIDDIEVTGGSAPSTGVVAVEPPAVSRLTLTTYPNPFRTGLTVRLAGSLAEPGFGRILDVAGRRVRDFALPARRNGASWVWDVRSDAGSLVPAGAYFVEVRAGTETRLSKVLLTR